MALKRLRRALAAVALLAACAARAVAAVPRLPPITPQDPASVQRGVLAAYRAGMGRVVLPPGVYRISPGQGGYNLRFSHLENFEIDADGVTLLWQDQTQGGILFDGCRNVALRGATLEDATPPFTQGKIVARSPDERQLDVRIARGYPPGLDDPRYFPADPVGYVFGPRSRKWKAGTHDFFARRVERLGAGLFRLHFDSPSDDPVAVGDRMAFRGNGTTDVLLAGCQGMTLAGVTIRDGGGFCVHEDGGEGGSRYSFAVTYGPRPGGAKEDPLIACNADAFHSSGVRRGPTLDGCRFEGMPDDGVAVHGVYAQVDRADGPRLVVAGGGFFRPGDPLRLYDGQGAPAGEAAVTAVASLDGYRPARPSGLPRFRGALRYQALTLDRSLPAQFDFLVSDPAAGGAGYVVRRCVIRDHRARGMLLKADDGLVEDNTVDGSTIAGIVVSPELYWNEADYGHHVVIRRNVIRHTGYATGGPDSALAGAVTVSGEGGGLGDADIRIEDNTFTGVSGVNLQIDHAQDIVVRGNHFRNTHRTPCRNGADRGIDPGAVVWLGRCRDVHLAGNTVAHRGRYGGRDVVVATTDALGVTGLPGGVR